MRRWKLAGAVAVAGCLALGAVPVLAVAQHTPRALAAPRAGKGAGAWVFKGVDKALAKSGASWYYTWATGHHGHQPARPACTSSR